MMRTFLVGSEENIQFVYVYLLYVYLLYAHYPEIPVLRNFFLQLTSKQKYQVNSPVFLVKINVKLHW